MQQRGDLPEALSSLERCRVYGMGIGKICEDTLVLQSGVARQLRECCSRFGRGV